MQTKLFIGNEWCDAASGQTMEVVNPATEEVIAAVASAGPDDLETAVHAARTALNGPWSALSARERGRLVRKLGERLLARHCGSCHAVGRSGGSPQKDAPAFRTLGSRYPVESLEEALGEGFMSGHPDMPEFKFDGDEVGAIIAYLKSIQRR